MQDDVCLRPGLRVQTFNKRPVGVVQQVHGGRLLVRNSLRRAFWLSEGLVRSIDGNLATLYIDSRVVDRYRQPVTRRRSATARRARAVRVPLAASGLAGAIVALVAIL
jgi:hypothetical protein